MTISKTETVARKDVQKLQRAIVDGLEDVKAQDIQVFNTEHLSPLFERVIIASGTSNRQTKALAASVRDAVRDAGLDKPRTEGEDNGEWIIVDCGAAVVHIMQPAIRTYYHLEEIWGELPVRLKLGAPKPAGKTATKPRRSAAADVAAEAPSRKPGRGAGAASAKAAAAPAKSARKTAAAGAGKTATGKTTSGKPAAGKTAAAKRTPAAAKRAARGAAGSASDTSPTQAPIKKVVIKAAARPAPRKSAATGAAAGRRAAGPRKTARTATRKA